jgi:hypothetical protein
MRKMNRHERLIAAPPERIAALIANLDRVWPAQVGPPPRPRGNRLYAAGNMLWEEFDRPGAARAFRVLKPAEWQAEHWFELEPGNDATVLRHTVEGQSGGKFEAIWRELVEPNHDETIEALFDNVEAAAARPPALHGDAGSETATELGRPRSHPRTP